MSNFDWQALGPIEVDDKVKYLSFSFQNADKFDYNRLVNFLIYRVNDEFQASPKLKKALTGSCFSGLNKIKFSYF